MKVIEVTPEQKKVLDAIVQEKNQAAILMRTGAFDFDQASERLWRAILDAYPEVKEYELSYNHSGLILVGAPKKILED